MSRECKTITSSCPCKKGTYSYESESDDWGRSSVSNYQMHCLECQQNYVLAYDEYSALQMRTDGWYWQKKEEYEREKAEKVKRHEEALARRKTIQPPTMEMSKQEIIAILKKELHRGMYSYGFNKSKSKRELIETYYQGTAYLDNL